MSGKRRWKEFLMWWNNYKHECVLQNSNPHTLDSKRITDIDNKIEEIKRGKNE